MKSTMSDTMSVPRKILAIYNRNLVEANSLESETEREALLSINQSLLDHEIRMQDPEEKRKYEETCARLDEYFRFMKAHDLDASPQEGETDEEWKERATKAVLRIFGKEE